MTRKGGFSMATKLTQKEADMLISMLKGKYRKRDWNPEQYLCWRFWWKICNSLWCN